MTTTTTPTKPVVERRKNNLQGLKQPLEPQAVADYIATNPDFLLKNPHLLAEILLPYSGDPEPFFQHQIKALRLEIQKLQQHLVTINQIATENDTLLKNTFGLSHALLETHDLIQIIQRLEKNLKEKFFVDHARLCLYDSVFAQLPLGDHFFQKTTQAYTLELLNINPNHQTIITGPLRPQALDFLFLKPEDIGSVALIPLHFHKPLGVLAIGSENPLHFRPDQGHFFLQAIQDILSRILIGAVTKSDHG